MATNLEPHECVIFCSIPKIGTNEHKAIHSTWMGRQNDENGK